MTLLGVSVLVSSGCSEDGSFDGSKDGVSEGSLAGEAVSLTVITVPVISGLED
jgi:hypothetical protein